MPHQRTRLIGVVAVYWKSSIAIRWNGCGDVQVTMRDSTDPLGAAQGWTWAQAEEARTSERYDPTARTFPFNMICSFFGSRIWPRQRTPPHSDARIWRAD